jgi:hypothetical protein
VQQCETNKKERQYYETIIIRNVTLDTQEQGLSFEMALFPFLFPHGHGAYDNIISLMNN